MSCGRRSWTRRARTFAGLASAAALTSGSASAAPPPTNGGYGADNGKFQMRTSAESAAPAEAARARVREGDCKGALAFFDAALRTSNNPLLFRDRGLCHDKLGDVYPAIDDYRAYVFADPDAPDVETIRARILELQGNAPPAEGDEESTNGTQANIDRVARGEVIARPKTEKRTTLKSGSGIGFGAYFGAGGLFFNDSKSSSSPYEKIGAQLRADFRPAHALVLEGGYFEVDDTTQGAAAGRPGGSGYGFYLGYELRIRLDKKFDNQLFIGIGGSISHIGEEVVAASTSAVGTGDVTQLLYGPVLRVGYRHVFSSTLAFDLTFEPSYLFDHPSETATVKTGSSSTTETLSGNDINAIQIGGHVALVFAP